MNRNTIPIGRIFGIPIGLDYSWFLIFALLTWSLAVNYYPAEFKNWPVLQYWVVGVATAIMLFVSVLLHELGHSLVAMRFKMEVRSITLLIFGGVAQIRSEPPSAKAEFWIAIAGPGVSFTLAIVFSLLEKVFTGIAPLLALVKYLTYINGTLGLFNLIPGFPLDGGRIFRAIVWGVSHSLRRATLIAATLGRLIAYIFILIGVWFMFTGHFANGLWIAFIGWFLESAAASQVQQQSLQDLLAGRKVSDVMNRQYTTIEAETTLQQLVDHHILESGRRCFVVTQGDETMGLLTLHRIREAPRAEWSTIKAAQVMIPLTQMKRVRPDAELWTALGEMDKDGVNQLPVMTDGQILGMLSRDDIIGFLRTRRELGGKLP